MPDGATDLDDRSHERMCTREEKGRQQGLAGTEDGMPEFRRGAGKETEEGWPETWGKPEVSDAAARKARSKEDAVKYLTRCSPFFLPPTGEVKNQNGSYPLGELSALTPRASLLTSPLVPQFYTKSACALLARSASASQLKASMAPG